MCLYKMLGCYTVPPRKAARILGLLNYDFDAGVIYKVMD